MSRIGSLVVRVQPGSHPTVLSRLEAIPGVEIADQTAEGFAVVLEARTAKQQRIRHEEIAGWPEVIEALVVFQSGQVEA